MQLGPIYIPFEYLVIGLMAIFFIINTVTNQRRHELNREPRGHG